MFTEGFFYLTDNDDKKVHPGERLREGGASTDPGQGRTTPDTRDPNNKSTQRTDPNLDSNAAHEGIGWTAQAPLGEDTRPPDPVIGRNPVRREPAKGREIPQRPSKLRLDE